MGKYLQGILGPFSGRVGNIIGTFWKGRSVMRVRAASHADANTIPQQTQRMKWKLVSAFLQANEKLVKLGFAAVDASLTALNSAMKANITTAITGAFPNLTLDLTKVKIAMGKLLGVESGVVTSTVAETVKLQWDDNSNNMDAFSSDKLMISITDSATGEVFLNGLDVTRADGTTNVVLPDGWTGRDVHVHAFFMKAGINEVTKADQVSDSSYLGNVVVA